MSKKSSKNKQTKKQSEYLKIPKVEKKTKINVVISKDFMDKVTLLNSRISQVEWSGVLFYKTTGSISDEKEMLIELKDILLMDIGTTAFTSYEFDASVIEFIEAEPQRFEWRIGHIHSHNNMETYFSGTDMDELITNSANYDYYLSIIVNNKLDIVGKVAYRGISEGLNYVFTDEVGNKISRVLTKQTEYVFIHDCNINKYVDPINIRINELIEEKSKIQAKSKKKKEVVGNLWDDIHYSIPRNSYEYTGLDDDIDDIDFDGFAENFFDNYEFDKKTQEQYSAFSNTIEGFIEYVLDDFVSNENFKETLEEVLPNVSYLTKHNFQIHYESKFLEFYRGLEPNSEVGLMIMKAMVDKLYETRYEDAKWETNSYKTQFIKLLKNQFYEY